MDLDSTVTFHGTTIRIPRPVKAPPDEAASCGIDASAPRTVKTAAAPLTRARRRSAARSSAARSCLVRRSSKLHSAYGQPVTVREVTTRRERDLFLKFPWRIYAGDKNWSPPLLMEAKAFIDRKKHPFYKHGDATLFLAYVSGEVVGRILVADDPSYNEQNGTNQGTFGCSSRSTIRPSPTRS